MESSIKPLLGKAAVAILLFAGSLVNPTYDSTLNVRGNSESPGPGRSATIPSLGHSRAISSSVGGRVGRVMNRSQSRRRLNAVRRADIGRARSMTML